MLASLLLHHLMLERLLKSARQRESFVKFKSDWRLHKRKEPAEQMRRHFVSVLCSTDQTDCVRACNSQNQSQFVLALFQGCTKSALLGLVLMQKMVALCTNSGHLCLKSGSLWRIPSLYCFAHDYPNSRQTFKINSKNEFILTHSHSPIV